jgi:SAM-dependent methyltransferase
MHVADNWFVGFQTELKARFWHAAAEPFADAEAKAIAGLPDLPAGARVLDAPSGGGRIAVRIAERGLDVLGIDLSEVEVHAARRVAADRGVGARFEQGDLRAPPERPSMPLSTGATASATCLTTGRSSTLPPCAERCVRAGDWCWRA